MANNVAETLVNNPPDKASDAVHEGAGTEPSDRELVARCQRGELEAYEVLVNRYREKVLRLAMSMTRNEVDATDLCQETFVKGWQAICGFKGSASFYTWLYRITTNLCIDHARKTARRGPSVELDEAINPQADANVELAPSSHEAPFEEVRRRELREQIDAALGELSPEHRAVVQLREFEGMDYANIARAVGCSIGTVMSRLHYARKHLQKLLRDVI
jgi:RNA polymerase sigma-70 factor (ECF subfamily)